VLKLLLIVAAGLFAYRLYQRLAHSRPAPNTGGHSPMTLAQAYEVLGLSPSCARQDIVDRHRRLIAAVHPDRGGSTFLAAQLNNAKDLLLQRHQN